MLLSVKLLLLSWSMTLTQASPSFFDTRRIKPHRAYSYNDQNTLRSSFGKTIIIKCNLPPRLRFRMKTIYIQQLPPNCYYLGTGDISKMKLDKFFYKTHKNNKIREPYQFPKIKNTGQVMYQQQKDKTFFSNKHLIKPYIPILQSHKLKVAVMKPLSNFGLGRKKSQYMLESSAQLRPNNIFKTIIRRKRKTKNRKNCKKFVSPLIDSNLFNLITNSSMQKSARPNISKLFISSKTVNSTMDIKMKESKMLTVPHLLRWTGKRKLKPKTKKYWKHRKINNTSPIKINLKNNKKNLTNVPSTIKYYELQIPQKNMDDIMKNLIPAYSKPSLSVGKSSSKFSAIDYIEHNKLNMPFAAEDESAIDLDFDTNFDMNPLFLNQGINENRIIPGDIIVRHVFPKRHAIDKSFSDFSKFFVNSTILEKITPDLYKHYLSLNNNCSEPNSTVDQSTERKISLNNDSAIQNHTKVPEFRFESLNDSPNDIRMNINEMETTKNKKSILLPYWITKKESLPLNKTTKIQS